VLLYPVFPQAHLLVVYSETRPFRRGTEFGGLGRRARTMVRPKDTQTFEVGGGLGGGIDGELLEKVLFCNMLEQQLSLPP